MADSVEQRRLAREVDQRRLARVRENGELNADDPTPARRLRERFETLSPQPMLQADTQGSKPEEAVVPQRLPQPLLNAQQLARDPAIAAAIAAYNLSAGPFAALNGRPDPAATRPKVIAPVEAVTKVAAIETDAATGESTRPSR